MYLQNKNKKELSVKDSYLRRIIHADEWMHAHVHTLIHTASVVRQMSV